MLAAAAALLACAGAEGNGSTTEPPPGQTTCPIPSAQDLPTFRATVLPMLQSTCGANSAISCHGTPSPRGHVSYSPALTADDIWAELVDVEPSSAPPGAGWLRIAAGDPSRSWLIEKVTQDDPGGAGQAYGNRMPLGLPDLCDPTVQTLRTWILLGAQND
ncbi:MAG: hypothetical protein QM767_29560 [Anaeromyxobacter sp.]